MTRPLFKVLCCLLAAVTALSSTVPIADEPAQAQAPDGPLTPTELRLDPLYDTVLLWSQDRNPPFYVYQWNIYLDGELQTSLRTNRYNMPHDGRSGTYTIEAETRDGVTSPRSTGFVVGSVTPDPTPTVPPVVTPTPTSPPVVTPDPTATPPPAGAGPLTPTELRLDPLYDTVLLWSQDRNPPFYVYQWNIYLDGELQTSLRTNRYNMPPDGRSGTYTIEAETRDGVTSPRSTGFLVGTTPDPTATPEPPTPDPTATPEPPTPDPTATPEPPTPDPTATPEPTEPPTPDPTATPEPPAPDPTATPEPPTPGLIWGYDATPPSSDWSRAALGEVTTDPIYGTEVVRRTDATGTRFDRNTYSRRQAENADGSYFMTYHGNATYRVYNRATNQLVRETEIHPNGEPQWHPTDPALIRHLEGANSYVGDLSLWETNVTTGESVVIADLASRIQARMPTADYMIDRAEGSPSMDGGRYAWIVYDGTETPIGLVSYDLASDTVLGIAVGLNESAYGRLDWVSMSPTGSYVMAGYGSGTLVYDADLTNERVVNTKADHSDIALDAFGRDAYVYIDFSSGPDAGFLVSVDLETLDRVRIFEVYGGANTSVHVSGKGYDKPGWVIVSTYSCKNPGAWTCEKVMAVEMAENGRVLNLAHTYNCGDNYWTETHAVVNRSFTRVYFNSDSGSCGIDAEVMELAVPEFG